MKNYLIIGGSSGIGAEVSTILAQAGNTVFSTYNTNSSNSDSDKVSYHFLDVTASDFDFLLIPLMV